MAKNKNQGGKSTIVKDAMVLFIITLIAGFALGLVYEIALPAIEERRLQAKIEAYKTVFESAEEFLEDDSLNRLVQEANQTNINVDEIRIAKGRSGEVLGYITMITTKEGYGGEITLLVGHTLEGVVTGIEILTINETAGLGAKAAEMGFKSLFSNKQVAEFVYTKTGAVSVNEIDVITGATITTAAVTEAVNASIAFINDIADKVDKNLGGERIE